MHFSALLARSQMLNNNVGECLALVLGRATKYSITELPQRYEVRALNTSNIIFWLKEWITEEVVK